MNHETIRQSLSDFVLGELAPAQAEVVVAHLATCVDCTELVGLMRAFSIRVSTPTGPEVGRHPTADELAIYALEGTELPPERMRELEDHLRDCGSCREENALARHGVTVLQSRTAEVPRSRHVASLFWRTLLPAAAMLALLAYPAYLGVFRYPELARESAAAVPPVSVGRVEDGSMSGPEGGGAAGFLLLPRQMRAAAAPVTYRLRTTQAWIPVLIDFDLSTARLRGLNPSVKVAVLADSTSSALWSIEAPAEELWDPGSQSVGLLVPRDSLPVGVVLRMVLEPRPVGLDPFQARFRLVEASTTP